jgi:hypothetical protein
MTHRDQIESAIREWGGRDRAELPQHLLNPQNEYDFMAVLDFHELGGPCIQREWSTSILP